MSDCVFCEIVKTGEAEGFRPEGPGVVSFIPLNPVTPGHRLFVPKVHATDAADDAMRAASAFEDAADWGAEKNEDFNIITSRGSFATQTVFHTHIHYVPRREGDGLFLPWTNQLKAEQ
jgi:histidine triad (HIT) family protein